MPVLYKSPRALAVRRGRWCTFCLSQSPRRPPLTVPDIIDDDTEINHAERAFLAAVLVCHGVRGQPKEADLDAAMTEMILQVQDNPPEGAPSPIIKRWLVPLSDLDRIKVAAAAFVKFGTTKPSIFQVRAAHRAIFGTDLAIAS